MPRTVRPLLLAALLLAPSAALALTEAPAARSEKAHLGLSTSAEHLHQGLNRSNAPEGIEESASSTVELCWGRGNVYFGARYYWAELGRWVSADPLFVSGLKDAPNTPMSINTFTYAIGNVFLRVDPAGLDTIIIIVGKDDNSMLSLHKLADGDSTFARRVDAVLNDPDKSAVAAGLTSEDQIYVVAPPSLDARAVGQIEFALRKLPAAQFVQADAEGVVELVNSFEDVSNIVFLGHGTHQAPIYQWDPYQTLPPAWLFSEDAFTPDAAAQFITCNSASYALDFAGYNDVDAEGVAGTTYWDTGSAVEMGRRTPTDRPGTSQRQRYVPTEDGVQVEESAEGFLK